jgi:hypothetical protein
MQDMIAIGEAWFEQQRRDHLAVQVEYRPLTGTARTVKATVVVGRWESVDAAGQMMRTETRDWFVHRSELAQDPKKGDVIATSEYNSEVLYEVSVPPGAQHHWQWADRNQNLRRIHTMVVKSAADRRPVAPGPPTNVAGTHGGPVTWTAPTTTGGYPVTSYRVYVGDVLQETVAAPATTSAGTYNVGAAVRVSAVNVIGEGAKSSPATIAPTVPGAPTITGSGSANQFFVTWTTPNDGGSPLTGYKLYANGVNVESGEQEGGWSNSSVDAYDPGSVIRVSAINAVGEGPLSAPVTVV